MKDLQEESFVSENTAYTISVPDQHWQLRDLLKNYKNKLLFCQDDKVMLFSPPEGNVKMLLTELIFNPVCVAAKDEIVCVGGIRGNYAVKNLQTGNLKCGNVGNTPINSVRINNEKIFCCTNGNAIIVFDLEMEHLFDISHACPVNNCEFSPNNEYLVSVGDSNCINVIDPKNCFEIVGTAQTISDYGFKVSWDITSTYFAVSTQDCHICVFDIRNLGKRVFKSEQKDINGACRNVEFSHGRSLDFLVFTEHRDYFHVIDTRDYKRKQTIHIPDSDITGCCFVEDLSRLYISTNKKIHEYEIFGEKRRTFGAFTIQ
ncbi:hypothetical protein EQH57_0026 [Dictyocoela roeselum]|nr:hypothetical protein EQH57_0026 [Dictyocoela roeselum]